MRGGRSARCLYDRAHCALGDPVNLWPVRNSEFIHRRNQLAGRVCMHQSDLVLWAYELQERPLRLYGTRKRRSPLLRGDNALRFFERLLSRKVRSAHERKEDALKV